MLRMWPSARRCIGPETSPVAPFQVVVSRGATANHHHYQDALLLSESERKVALDQLSANRTRRAIVNIAVSASRPITGRT